METTLPNRRQDELSIGIVYADMISGAMASRIARRLQAKLRNADVQIHFCSFRELQVSAESHTDPGEFCPVDLLILASLDAWLPAGVQNWLGEWMAQRRGDRVAIAALMYARDPQQRSISERLQRMCRKHDVDFIECTKTYSLGAGVENAARSPGRPGNPRPRLPARAAPLHADL